MNTGNNIGQISINNVAFDHYAKLPLIEFLFSTVLYPKKIVLFYVPLSQVGDLWIASPQNDQ